MKLFVVNERTLKIISNQFQNGLEVRWTKVNGNPLSPTPKLSPATINRLLTNFVYQSKN